MSKERTYTSATWDYAADCATKDGFRPGSSEWMQRIRDLLPVVSENVSAPEAATPAAPSRPARHTGAEAMSKKLQVDTMRPYSVGRLLYTHNTRGWSEEQRSAAEYTESCMVFAGFNAEDEGRSRRLVARCETPEDARMVAAALNAARQSTPEAPSPQVQGGEAEQSHCPNCGVQPWPQRAPGVTEEMVERLADAAAALDKFGRRDQCRDLMRLHEALAAPVNVGVPTGAVGVDGGAK